MEEYSCYSSVLAVFEKASKELSAKGVPINTEKSSRLDEICDLLDLINAEIYSDDDLLKVSVSADLDRKQMRFNICTAYYFGVCKKNGTHPFFELLQLVDSVHFYMIREDVFVLAFWLDDLWK